MDKTGKIQTFLATWQPSMCCCNLSQHFAIKQVRERLMGNWANSGRYANVPECCREGGLGAGKWQLPINIEASNLGQVIHMQLDESGPY